MSNETTTLDAIEAEATTATAAEIRQSMGAVKLSFTWLGTQRKLSDTQTKQAADVFDAQKDLVTASKRLIDTKHPAYRAATQIKSQAAAYWRSVTLPYPQGGVRLIKHEDIATFETTMLSYQAQLAVAAANLQLEYDAIKTAAREKLGQLFNPADYPVTLENVFELTWEYPSVEPPPYLMGFNPEIYRQEQARVQARFETAVAMAEEAFATKLSELIEHLVTRLTDAPGEQRKTFHASTIENFTEFYDNFKKMNVRSNAQLEALIHRANDIIAGVRATSHHRNFAQIRNNAEVRGALVSQMSAVQVALDNLIVTPPARRVMRMEPE